MKAGEKNYLRNQMAQRPTVTQMSRKFESHAFTPGVPVLLFALQQDVSKTGILISKKNYHVPNILSL